MDGSDPKFSNPDGQLRKPGNRSHHPVKGTRTRTGTGTPATIPGELVTGTLPTPPKNGKEKEAEKSNIPPVLDGSDLVVESTPANLIEPTEPVKIEPGLSLDTGSTAVMLLTLIDGFAISIYGDLAHMTDTEKKMIQPPLSRILARLPHAEVIDKYMDPFMLLAGLITWGMRVNRDLEKSGRKPISRPAPAPARTNPAPAPEPRPGEEILPPSISNVLSFHRSESL